jgi:cytochrome c biogenesis protein CcmG/thiol:disulfide interchange protein DsbE
VTATETARGRPRFAPYVALGVAVVLGLFVLLLATSKDEVASSSPLIDKAAPAIVGSGFRGDEFDLDAQRGKWVVVNFFSTTCVPCIQEHPELKAWSERHAAAGDASIVSVTFDDSPDSVRSFFEENGGDWPVLVDRDITGSIAISYGVTLVPESYLVDPFGIVRVKIIGGVTAEKLDDYLSQVQGAS